MLQHSLVSILYSPSKKDKINNKHHEGLLEFRTLAVGILVGCPPNKECMPEAILEPGRTILSA